MTISIKGIYVGKTYVSLSVDKEGLYTASLSSKESDAGYRNRKTYRSYDRQKAMAAFRRYKKEVIS